MNFAVTDQGISTISSIRTTIAWPVNTIKNGPDGQTTVN
jgi:hypothetical protein